jgi:redox-sensitive bicupin YhaK (pirin superfamily)
VRRADERFTTQVPGRTTRHLFSFGGHYDPANVGFGALVCLNDDLVASGHGYAEHPHRDLEIVTWVLDGALRHEDTSGTSGEVRPGQVQRLSAGSGVRHSEWNADPARPVRFLQMWVVPDRPGLPPSYAQCDVGADLASAGWVTLASGDRHDTAVPLGRAGVALDVARLPCGRATAVPGAPASLLYVARGEVDLEGPGPLRTGDCVRLTDDGGRRLLARGDAEVLVWRLPWGR